MSEHCQDHDNKMCALTCCPCRLDLKKIGALTKGAQFICKSCGHVAKDAASLCDPAPIE